MRKFVYKKWSSREATVQADRVTFEPGHVVFWLEDGRLILAEDNANVHELREVIEP